MFFCVEDDDEVNAIKIKLKKKMLRTTILNKVRSSVSTPHLDVLVTVGAVVNDGERLLEAGTSDADDIGNQLTDSNYHLDE